MRRLECELQPFVSEAEAEVYAEGYWIGIRASGGTIEPHWKHRFNKISLKKLVLIGEFPTFIYQRCKSKLRRIDIKCGAYPYTDSVAYTPNHTRMHEQADLSGLILHRRYEFQIQSHASLSFESNSHRKADGKVIGNGGSVPAGMGHQWKHKPNMAAYVILRLGHRGGEEGHKRYRSDAHCLF